MKKDKNMLKILPKLTKDELFELQEIYLFFFDEKITLQSLALTSLNKVRNWVLADKYHNNIEGQAIESLRRKLQIQTKCSTLTDDVLEKIEVER